MNSTVAGEYAMVREIDPAELQSLVGQELGASRWLTVDQPMIQAFATTTMDQQWIHVDVERAKREGAGPIAHGFLIVSLMSTLLMDIWTLRGSKSALNYGFNKLRFIAPVPSGARIRMTETLTGAEQRGDGVLLTRDCRVEVESGSKPAVVAEWLALFRL
jgi:acyl dehydratase